LKFCSDPDFPDPDFPALTPISVAHACALVYQPSQTIVFKLQAVGQAHLSQLVIQVFAATVHADDGKALDMAVARLAQEVVEFGRGQMLELALICQTAKRL
jgi:hypothetical protein